VPQLFSYTVRFDDGAAPNPFNGLCTLAICKPGIRAAAKSGDWIAGIGSSNAAHGRDLSHRLVYAMRVKESIPLAEYHRRAQSEWPDRIPKINSKSLPDRLGDCIYYEDHEGKLLQRKGSVHNQGNYARDVSGKNVLISDHFYYFGREAILLPEHLYGIRHPFQGHKRQANDHLVQPFIDWISSLNFEVGQLYGWPDHMVDWSQKSGSCGGCAVRQLDDEHDPSC